MIVDNLNLEIFENEFLALVGGSGSGKTLTALAITRLLPDNVFISAGRIIFRGRDLLAMDEPQIESIRGKDISYIFQEAGASLNPVLSIGRQITESIRLHQDKNRKDAELLALELLELTRLPHPRQILRSYPHQLSGGMNQRVMIAMALCSGPKLLIADEPTTALDVTVEAQIMRLLLEAKEKTGLSILFITHNLALIEKYAHEIAIMHQGRLVESGKVRDIFSRPKHSHTRELVDSIIRL